MTRIKSYFRKKSKHGKKRSSRKRSNFRKRGGDPATVAAAAPGYLSSAYAFASTGAQSAYGSLGDMSRYILSQGSNIGSSALEWLKYLISMFITAKKWESISGTLQSVGNYSYETVAPI